MGNLGIALSGGGSRAIAFHRGTVRALAELGVIEAIDVVSSASGGSVFAAAWMVSMLDHTTTSTFLDDLVPVLRRGFVMPAVLSPRILKLMLPGFNRTHRLAEVFSDLLGHRRLAELPERPKLCLNAAALDHAMPGRFSRGGFSCKDVGAVPEGSQAYPEAPLKRRDLGFAVAASAAFPFALPPLPLDADELLPFEGELRGHSRLHLTDGGVLENLGVERLMSDGRFRCRDMIVSDAGAAQKSWTPSWMQRLLSFGAYAFSRDTLSRLLMMMNDKQNRTMRQLVMNRVGAAERPSEPSRLWFIRADQTWDHFFEAIPRARLREIAGGVDDLPRDATSAQIVALLLRHRPELERAVALRDPASEERASAVEINFTGLAKADIDALERHAMWQVHACRAVYGEIVASSAGTLASTDLEGMPRDVATVG